NDIGKKLIKLFGTAELALGVAMTSCSIEDGKDGVDGIDGRDGQDGLNGADGQDGADGEDGAPGQDGADGKDGAGLEEMAQYGAVTMLLTGTRPDNVPFEQTTSFKFTPLDPEDFFQYNILTTTQIGDDTEYF